MVRGCSDSDSEEERHDRFKSERNVNPTPLFRSKVPSSLDSYTRRARSPVRPNSFNTSRHRSRYSEERKYSPPRRHKSPDRKYIRDQKSPRYNDVRRSSSLDYKNRSKRSHEKVRDPETECRKQSKDKDIRYSDSTRDRGREHKHKSTKDRKRSSKEKDSKHDCIKRRKSRDDEVDREPSFTIDISDKSSDSLVHDDIDATNDEEAISLPRYYEIADDTEIKNNSDNKPSKKHKKPRERSESRHDSKKRKKDKKHRRKHEKRKSDCDTDLKITEDNNKSLEDISNSSEGSQLNLEDQNSEINAIDEVVNNKSLDLEEPVDLKNDEPVQNKPVSDHEEGEISGSESEQFFGPALPPGKKTEKVYGPEMPSDPDLYGPALPPPQEPPATIEEEEEEDCGDVIGPLPAGLESSVQSALDARASLLKYQMENKTEEDKNKKREEWMLELPEVRGAQIGLGPRKFRNNAAPDMSDRSSWTDTPQDKARKRLLGTEESCDIDTKKLEIIERNKEMEQLAKKSEKKSKSLLDMHQKELKKKKKKEEKERGDKPVERRPFSREHDLQTNKFDEAQKKSIIKKAQLLNTRFSAGESKFL